MLAAAAVISIAATLADYMHRVEAFGFSGSVLVARQGQVLLHQSYGIANSERNVRVTPRMPFFVASITKPFTAAAILRLEMDGKLSVSDSIATHLAGVPESRRAITIDHLLTHRSGVADPDERHLDRDAFVRAALDAPPRFEPGARYEYSNAGYSLLAAIIERVSGESFEHYMRTHIFRPAGMEDSYLVTDPGAPDSPLRVYRGDLDQGDARLTHHRRYGWDERGATGLMTTPMDLYRWHLAIPRVLPGEAGRKYESKQTSGYGYGWAHPKIARGRLLMHDGQILPEGWNGDFRRYLDDDIVVVVLSNRMIADPLSDPVGRNLARLVIGGAVEFPPAVAGGDASAYAGVYVLPTGGQFRITARSIEAMGQDAINLLTGRPADTFAEENARTSQLIEALAKGSSTEERPARVWRQLEAQIGPYVRYEVLHSAKASDADLGVTTFVRLHFAKGTTVGRYIWSEGKLIGSFDMGSFDGPAKQVEVFPATMSLVSQDHGRFAAWFFAGKTTIIAFERDSMSIGGVAAKRQ